MDLDRKGRKRRDSEVLIKTVKPCIHAASRGGNKRCTRGAQGGHAPLRMHKWLVRP